MKALESAYAERLHGWYAMAVEKIAEKVRVDGPERLLSNGTGLGLSVLQLSNDLINLRTRIANFGRGQFNEEIKRQGRRT